MVARVGLGWRGAAGQMTPHRRRVVGPTGEPDAAERAPRLEATRSLVAAADYWASADAVRQVIGAWAYTLPPAEARPNAAEVREAVAVAGALRERERVAGEERWQLGGSTGSGTAAVLDLDDLAERTGLSERTVGHALDLLRRVRLVVDHRSGAVATVSLDASALNAQPCVARLAWDGARDRLRAVGASLAPALAVWREVAGVVGAYAGDAAPPVRLSVRMLEERTGYGRSTVSEALSGLERARLVDLELRAGRTARVTLRPASFGRPDVPPAPPPVERTSVTPPPAGHATDRGAVARDENGVGRGRAAPVASHRDLASGANAPVAAPGGASVRVGEFAGIPIHAPPGTPVTVECDASGRWLCRVGPYLVLGPVGPEAQ